MIVFSTEWTVFNKVEAYRQNSKLKKTHNNTYDDGDTEIDIYETLRGVSISRKPKGHQKTGTKGHRARG